MFIIVQVCMYFFAHSQENTTVGAKSKRDADAGVPLLYRRIQLYIIIRVGRRTHEGLASQRKKGRAIAALAGQPRRCR